MSALQKTCGKQSKYQVGARYEKATSLKVIFHTKKCGFLILKTMRSPGFHRED